MVKIGYTAKSPERRINEIIGKRPGNHRLLGTHAGEHVDERLLHKKFSKIHLSGEWFRAVPGLLKYIENCCSDAGLAHLASIESELLNILQDAKSYQEKRPRNFCATAAWLGTAEECQTNSDGLCCGLKRRVHQYAGPFARKSDLRNWEAYDVVRRAVQNALPACSHQGCC